MLWAAFFASLGSAQQLPKLNIDTNQISVSGLSSGAAFAVQFQVSYSKSIMGVGVVAGPPYWCAMDDLGLAQTSCRTEPNLIDISKLVAGANYAFKKNSIDDPANIKTVRAFYWTGLKDTTLFPGVVEKAKAFYDTWVPATNSFLYNNVSAVHGWVTDSYGLPCTQLGSPYIINCNLDMAGVMLQHIYSNTLKPRGTAVPGNIAQFDQAPYLPAKWTPTSASLGKTGYVYVPTACKGGTNKCKLHVVFHGCIQDAGQVGEDLVQHAGLNEWAEVNDIVVVYPQTNVSNTVPYNPQACWDWWGYTGADYACQFAPQITTVNNMIKAITG